MEIESSVALVFASGVMITMLGLSLVSFASLIALLISFFSDWIMGSV